MTTDSERICQLEYRVGALENSLNELVTHHANVIKRMTTFIEETLKNGDRISEIQNETRGGDEWKHGPDEPS